MPVEESRGATTTATQTAPGGTADDDDEDLALEEGTSGAIQRPLSLVDGQDEAVGTAPRALGDGWLTPHEND